MVHRDIKPQNMVLHERERRFKLIDLGACADLRTGANFSPDGTYACVYDPLALCCRSDRHCCRELWVPLSGIRDLSSSSLGLPPCVGEASKKCTPPCVDSFLRPSCVCVCVCV